MPQTGNQWKPDAAMSGYAEPAPGVMWGRTSQGSGTTQNGLTERIHQPDTAAAKDYSGHDGDTVHR